MSAVANYLSLIKFSHTIFALPFAIIGFFLATHHFAYGFEAYRLLLVVLCMVFARSAAMAFNRYADRHIDAQNPRTAIREIPGGYSWRAVGIRFCLAQQFVVYRHYLVYQSLVFLLVARSFGSYFGI